MSVVYFIEAIGADGIKIGTAHDVLARLATLQTGNQFNLLLRASAPGGESIERAYHRRFAQQHIRGEWFTFSGPIEKYLNRDLAKVGTRGRVCDACPELCLQDDFYCAEHTPHDRHDYILWYPPEERQEYYARALELQRSPKPVYTKTASIPLARYLKPCSSVRCANQVDYRKGLARCGECG